MLEDLSGLQAENVISPRSRDENKNTCNRLQHKSFRELRQLSLKIWKSFLPDDFPSVMEVAPFASALLDEH